MKKTVQLTASSGNRRNRMKGLASWSFLGMMAFATEAKAQSVFTETMGSVPGTTTIAAHETANGFDNDAYLMTGTADVRNTSPSSGYTNASGAANIFITNTTGRFFQIEGINTTAFTSVHMSFGIMKSTTASTAADLIVEVSTDGTTYTQLSFPALPTGTGTADWFARTVTGIPSAANLRVRFRQNGTATQYRIDDMRMSGTITCPTATVSPSGSVAICQGNSTTLTASSGTSYLWSNGATTQSISVNTAGSYSVTVNGPGFCSSTSAPTTVTVTPLPSSAVSANGPTTFCNGGSVVLTAAETGATYSWSNGSSSRSITVSNSGNFSVTVTKNGCSATSSATTVTEVANPTAVITVGGNGIECQGGGVTLTANPAASYLWSNGATTQSISATVSGGYTVQVTDATGCTSAPSAPEDVYIRPLPIISAGADQAICEGGSANLSATMVAADLFFSEYVEGSGNNKYIEIYNGTAATVNLNDYRLRNYSNGNTVPNFDNLLSGTLAPGQTAVYRNSAATIYSGAATPQTAVVFNGNDAVVLYKISTNSNVDIFGRIGNDPGTEWTSGTASTENVTLRRKTTIYSGVTVNPAETGSGAFLTLSDWDVFAIDNVSGLGAHSINGSFTWSPATGLNTTDGADVVAAPAATTTYTVTGDFACSNADAVVVTVNANPTGTTAVTNVSCNGGNDGAIDLTVTAGQAPFTYLWSNGATTEDISGLAAGSYSADIISATGCTSTFSATVSEPTLLSVSSVQGAAIACNGGSTTVTVSADGGTAPYTGLGTFEVTADTYDYTVTDANGCTATNSITITEPAALVISAAQDASILCNGETTTVTVSASGGTAPYSGIGTYEAGPGTHNYTVIDANGCESTASVIITEPALLEATSVLNTAILCHGGTTTVSVSANGGTAPYEGVGTFTVGAGTYSYTIIDANGCTTTTSITVTQPTPLTATSAQQSAILCFGGNSTVQVNANGGTAPYSGTGYFHAPAGTHSYTVTDANGCTAVTSITISQPATPVSVAIATLQDRDKCGRNIQIFRGYGVQNIQLNGSATGGTGAKTYSWSPAAGLSNPNIANPVASPTTTTTYTLTARDANGCTSTATVVVNVMDVRCGTILGIQQIAVCHEIVAIVGGVEVRTQEQLCIPTQLVASTLLNLTNTCLGTCVQRKDEAIPVAIEETDKLVAYPNPFSEKVTVKVAIADASEARLEMIDMMGKKIVETSLTLENGRGQFEWNGTDMNGAGVNEGVYFCVVRTDNATETIRIVLQK